MEGGKLRAVVMVVLVLGMLIGQSRASFKDCYVKCYVFCIVDPSQTLCSCTTHCLKDCIFPPSPLDVNHPTHSYRDFCTHGCASSLCFNISTKQHPNGKNMQSCVGSCSKKCTKNF
ncbi:hypothetical protein LguiB_023200 [Lonicera macranthoides]